MKKSIGFVLALFVALSFNANAQTCNICNTCTTTISTVVNGNVSVSGTDVLCITSTGVINGNLSASGSTKVCNKGTVNGDVTLGNSAELCNEGYINSVNFTIGGSNTFNNYGKIRIDGNLTVSGSAIFNSLCGFDIGGNLTLSGSATYVFRGKVVVGGNLTFSGSATAEVYGVLIINGDLYLGLSSQLRLMSGAFASVRNISQLSGSTKIRGMGATYGQLIVSGTTTSSGTGGYNGNIDVCLLNSPGSPPSGSTTGSVTYCTNNVTPDSTTNALCSPNILCPEGIIEAGSDAIICAGNTYTLVNANATRDSSRTWTTSGNGTFNNPTLLNPTYTPSALDITNGSVRLRLNVIDSCQTQVADSMLLTILSTTVSNAGPDQSVCATSATLAGNTPTAGTGVWTLVSGTGTITTPSSPTSGVTGLGIGPNVFRWTITNGSCSPSVDEVTITRYAPPTTSAAGSDQSVCGTSATLAGNTPTTGSGIWTLVSGTGSISSPTSPNSGVTGLGVGPNVFRWTISNGSCPPSVDEVTITRYEPPSAANAGPDQAVCATSTTLAGNTPTIGTGTWTLISGTGTISSPNNPTTGVSGLAIGPNVFRWTISNGPCTVQSDEVTITVDSNPVTPNAGTDQNICVTNATLTGNNPAPGTGTWTLLSGTGTITSPNNPTTTVTGLGVGENRFLWTISSGACAAASDDVSITVTPAPVAPTSATVDRNNMCTTDAGNIELTAIGGSGTTLQWFTGSCGGTLVGTGTPLVLASPTTTTTYYVRWINFCGNSTCASVTVTVDQLTTTANAGPDQSVCATSATLAGNNPTVGTGAWTLVSGGGTITNPADRNSTVTGLNTGINVFRSTITNGSCASSSDEVTITVYQTPTTADAGTDQSICATSTTLAGNNPTIGTGTWTLISGGGTIADPANPTSGVNGLNVGVNVFRWTVVNGVCASSFDEVTVTVYQTPTTAVAGSDQSICATSTTLAGNTPAIGTGTWTLISGGGTISSPNDPASGVTGLSPGANIFQWTIANGACASSFDVVTITVYETPTTANAGTDQAVCATSTTLAGNTPAIGTGTWTLISGGGTFSNPNSPTSGVNGLNIGPNVFRWTITNGVCPPSFDEVTITVDANPVTPNAGADQTLCASNTTLTGNDPAPGTGMWSLVSGTGTITTPSSPSTGVTGLGIGQNIFRWTISSGTCAAATDDVIITVDANPTPANAGTNQTVCATSATLNGNVPTVGSGTWSLVSGTGTITLTVNPNSGVSGLGIGPNVFRWTITNGVCPPSTHDVTITRDENPTPPVAGANQNICATSTTLNGNTPVVGTGLWTLVSGTGTITNPSSPTSGVTGLGVGPNVFRWTITNGVCPPANSTVTITRDENPTVSNPGTNQTVCVASATLNGNIPAVGTGVWSLVSGTGTITNPSSPTSGVTGLGVGSNVFRWTITNGVCPPSTGEVTITRDAEPSPADAGTPQTICSATTTLNGNVPTIGTGTWSTISGGGIVTTPSDPNSGVTNLAVGPNVFRWTISNGVCPPTSADVTISRDPEPTPADAGTNQTVCSTTANLQGNTISIGAGVWTTISGGGTVTTPSDPNSGVTNLAVGSNVFRWTISNGVCPSSSDEVTITRDAEPTPADAGVDQTLCATTGNLNGNTPTTGTGTWTLISGTGNISNPNNPASGVNGLSVGNNVFRWTISNGVCPPVFDEVTITVSPNPVSPDAGADQTICTDNTTLTGNDPTPGTGTWSLVSGTGTITSPNTPTTTVTGLGIGANTFRWTITSGACAAATADVVITVDAEPTVSDAGIDQTICATTATLDGNTPTVGTGTWTLVSGTGTITTPSSPTSGVTGLGLGANVFRWTVSNGVCTDSFDEVTITVDQAPTTANAGGDRGLCAGETQVNLNATAPTPGVGQWTLQTGTGTITDPSDPATGVTGLTPGSHTFRWTVSNGACVDNSFDEVTVTVGDTVVLSVNHTEVTCNGQNNGTAAVTPSGGFAPYTYLWTPSMQNSPTATNLPPGVHYIAVTDTAGCTAIDSVEITEPTPMVLTMSANDTICGGFSGGSVSVTVTGGTGPYTYLWTPTADTNASLTGLPTGTYTVTVTDDNGCQQTGTASVVVDASILADFTFNPSSGVPPLTVDFTNLSTGGTSFLWDFGNGGGSTQTHPQFIYYESGEYTIMLVAISDVGCTDTAYNTIFVEPFIPNVFTPNGDGKNDIFRIKAPGMNKFYCEIYNRWGQKIYEWDTTMGGWDGRSSGGEEASPGTYYFVLTMEKQSGDLIEKTGTVNLFR